MHTLKFKAKISKEKTIKIPESYKNTLEDNQEVNVILLYDNDSNEEWNNFTVNEFLKGYSDKDSIYDNYK